MTFVGSTLCPVCRGDIAWELQDVFRKVDDDYKSIIECPKCAVLIEVALQIRHHVEIVHKR